MSTNTIEVKTNSGISRASHYFLFLSQGLSNTMSTNSLVASLHANGAVAYDHSDSNRDLRVRRQLENYVSCHYRTFEVIESKPYSVLIRRKQK